MRIRIISILLLISSLKLFALDLDSNNYNLHFQQTVILQYKPKMTAKYSGTNSLMTDEESETSLTNTFFIGLKPFEGTEIYFNPEIAGGSGISQVLGIAGAPNGETFRIGNPKPELYVARLFTQSYINLSNNYIKKEDKANQLPSKVSDEYLLLKIGKYSVADNFDCNKYSHDARTQFMNWSLMSNGAWDFPANIRGYTWNLLLEYGNKDFAIRFISSLVPNTANGSVMDMNIANANSETIEFEKPYKINDLDGKIRILGFYTQAKMGVYKDALFVVDPLVQNPDIIHTRAYGRNKYGFGLNLEQDLSKNIGCFLRGSWNDGKNETWHFTEIDNAISGGIVFNANAWNRPSEELGIAFALNGISTDHQNYLKAGGLGFMLGDGNLNYINEFISEIYYNIHLHDNHFWISPDLQYIVHPAYNKDRGPALAIAVRAHVEF
ncbi:MAG: carbohydrate porin [Candidatus Kapabacteria bacterium]|nr:carbohydrate porin [Candidatus Kapabacteria bacterium]